MNALKFFTLGLALTPAFCAAVAPGCQAQSGARTGALLELYTSEGCSSCPPADRWFAGLATKADPQRLSLLAFHVDYWDEIGWPDRYAQHAFTERQSARVRTGGSTTVYTPQVMSSSRLGLRWYKPEQVMVALNELQQLPSQVAIDLRVTPSAGHWQVSAQAQAKPGISANAKMVLALYENGLSTVVKAGENRGVTLHHERVVRSLWGPWSLLAGTTTQTLRINSPASARSDLLGLTAFVQDTRTGETLQALSLPLAACGASALRP